MLNRIQGDLASGRYKVVIADGLEAASTFRKSGDLANEGRALTGVGLAQLYSGDYPGAFDHFTQALNLARDTGNVEAEITRLNNLGTVLYYQGRYSDAMARYQQAMQRVKAFPNEKWNASRRQFTQANIAILYQTLGQFDRALGIFSELLKVQRALPPREEAQLLANAGTLRRRLGDPAKALETYRSAQALYKKAAHRDGEIAVLNNIGIVQAMDLSDFKAATASFTTALQLADKSGDRPLIVHARLYRGETLYRAGRLDESLVDFQVAADTAAALGELEERWKAIYGLARIASDRHETAKADRLLSEAVGLIESLRAGLATSSLRSDFLADKRDVYDALIQHTSDPATVFHYMEQSRARNLRDRVLPAQPRSLKEVATSLAPDTVVLEYWLGQTAAAVLWISRSDTGLRRIDFTTGERNSIPAVAAILADPHDSSWRNTLRPIANRLLSGIRPLETATIQRVIVVPDGLLARMPFETLPFDDSRLLIERFTVSYSPSAAMLTTRRSRTRLWPWQRTLNGFADPAPGTGTSGVELTSARAWPRLPQAAREVTGIADILGGKPETHIGPEARKAFLEGAPEPPILHFATHAYADMQDPDRSYILLAPSSPSQQFDYLFLKEVYELPLSTTGLVTVSACQTDTGKLIRGEGVESFSRAFLGAGAGSVVTSLWRVGDTATAELMLRFYTGLAKGTPKAEALRSAKLEFLRNPASAHPAYWAAFVLNGDGDSSIPYVVGWTWFSIPAAVLLAAVFFAIRRWAGRA